jgi:uncharacterized cupin superfamily protein
MSILGPITESAIRALHHAPEVARVSKYVYEPGDSVEGTSKRSTCYVLEGRFQFTSEEGSASFEKGDVFVFAGGDYLLTVETLTAAIVVWAWELANNH